MPALTRLRAPVLVALCLFLFFVAHRGAWEGYFNDDDLDNLHWTRHSPWPVFAQGLADPRFSAANFRPAGHAVYKALGSVAGLDFRPYLALLQLLHLLNVFLLWRLARRLSLTPRAAALTCLFFSFHMAAFDACWKPMFLFDVLVTTWLLAALLLYCNGRAWWALVPFWLAYKTKEIAIGLPAILLLYECWLGQKRWRRVLPFAAVSLSFAVQALFRRPAAAGDYSLQFTGAAFWDCLRFYAGKILLLPWAGFLLLPLALWRKEPLLRFALACLPFCLGPLLFLPGRKFSVYLYLALALLSLAVGFLTSRLRPVYAAALFVPWLAFNFQLLRQERKATLAVAHENRAFVSQLAALAPVYPAVSTLIYDGQPSAMNRWGVEGALRWHWPGAKVRVLPVEQVQSAPVAAEENVLLVNWDRGRHKMRALPRASGAPDLPYIRMDSDTPVWQLLEGWFPQENDYRWTQARAQARLRRPPGANRFELRVNVGQRQLDLHHRGRIEVFLAGRSLGIQEFPDPGLHTHLYPIPAGLPESVAVEFRVDPPLRPPGEARTLGLALGGFGFR
jgi:hypothetical protein